MITRTVITLVVVLDDELPVRVFDHRRDGGDLCAPRLMRRDVRRHGIAEAGDVGEHIGKTDVDHAAHDFDMHGTQAIRFALEVRGHLPRIQERTVEFVDPLMISARQPMRSTRPVAGR